MSSAELDQKGVIIGCPHCQQRNRLFYEMLDKESRCGKCRTVLPIVAAPINVPNEGVFQTMIQKAALPVLVDYWADWCGPCKMIAPELQKVAAQNAGKFLVAKVNTELLPGIAQQMQISSIPTLGVFRNGRELTRTAGVRPAAEIQALVQRAIHP